MSDNFEEVPASKITPIQKPIANMTLPDIVTINERFWFLYDNGSMYNKYKTGVITGSYAEARCNTKTVFEIFFEIFKGVLRSSVENEDLQMADYDTHIKLLKIMFDLMEENIDSTLKSETFGDELLASMYGAFVGYVNNNMKE